MFINKLFFNYATLITIHRFHVLFISEEVTKLIFVFNLYVKIDKEGELYLRSQTQVRAVSELDTGCRGYELSSFRLKRTRANNSWWRTVLLTHLYYVCYSADLYFVRDYRTFVIFVMSWAQQTPYQVNNRIIPNCNSLTLVS